MKRLIPHSLVPFAIAVLVLGAAQARALAGLSGTWSVGPTGTYHSVTAAFNDIAAQGGLSGAVIFELQSTYVSTVEAFPITAVAWTGSGSANTVTIRPAGTATGLSITSGNATGTFDLNAATYVILDGRPGGSGTSKELTIENTNTLGFAIRFINGAQYNSLLYLKVRGVNTGTSSGVVVFSTSTGAGGNADNTIDTCDLFDSSTTPTNIIYSSGTTGKDNHTIVVRNCNIYNFFNAASTHIGINLSSNNQDWTIQGNSFYETTARSMTGTGTLEWQAITCGSSSTNNIQILENYIGGSAPSCGGGAMTYTGNATIRALRLTVGTTIPTSIQGNVFRNIQVSSTSASSSQAMIGAVSGSFNIGTAIPNVIGSQNTTGSLTFALSNVGSASFAAISCGTGTPGTINISNNLIGGIAIQQVSSVGSATARGIYVYAGGTPSNAYTVSGNTIGSTTTANSFTCANGTLAGILAGTASSYTYTADIAGNTIANLAYLGTSSTGYQLLGISVTGNSYYTVRGNSIHDLSSASTGAQTGTSASVIGISMTANVNPGQTVSGNTVYGLSNSAATAATCVTGIHYSGPIGTNTVAKNLIHTLALSTSGFNILNQPQITGIYVNGGATRYLNNMIRLGFDSSGTSITAGHPITGIFEATGTDSFYGNSVYIGGAGVVSNQHTFAFQSSVTINQRSCQDNILMNARSNVSGTAKNYAVRYQAIDAGLSSDYNDLYVSGHGGIVGATGAGGTIVDYPSLAQWQAGTLRDQNSRSADPLFINPTGSAAAGDLHIQTNIYPVSPVARAGVSLAALTDDYDGDARAAVPCTGADEFATHLITAIAGAHGSITPSGSIVVNAGWDLAFIIAPDPGYFIFDVIVDGISIGPVGLFTLNNIQADHTISASFGSGSFVIVATADAGGSITPSGNVVVLPGTDQEFIIAPDSCYSIYDVAVDGAWQGPIPSFTFFNFQENHTIHARFALTNFTLITSVVGSGALAVIPPKPFYPCGDSVHISAAGGPGWGFDHWTGDAAGADNPLLVIMDADKTITGVFVDIAAPIVQVVSPNGGELWITGTSQTIAWTAVDNVAVTTVDLDYSTDGGASYPYAIAGGLANSGSYPWVIPATGSKTVRVRVTAHDPAGNLEGDASDADFEIQDPASSVASLLLGAGEAWGVYPNPAFAGQAHVLYRILRPASVVVSIFAPSGHLVRRLDSGSFPAGIRDVVWDGLDESGNRVAGGLYLVRFSASTGMTATKRLVLIR